MNRRKLLKRGSCLGWAAAGAGDAALASAQEPRHKSASATPPERFVLQEITIDELQRKMQSGAWTSRQITEMYLHRIEEIDARGIRLNSVIERNPDAPAIAARMDEERKSGKVRGPLHGIPVLIKDNIDTADAMMTTTGALALVGNKAAQDAFILKRLREAGAVPLGKTNLSEWANFRSTRSTSGWSSRGGQTRNPYVLDRNPCGSSSGSGAAVAANLCAVALGTETDGSIIAPASYCGIVGLKPTVGLWSRSGIIPISKTQDTAGPMTRTVKDAAILLGALSGPDPADPATRESAGRASADYTRFLDPQALKGRRIGVEKSFFTGDEDVVELYRQAIGTMQKLGAEVVEVELLKACKDLGEAENTVLRYEFKDGVNAYLSHARASVSSLADVIAFNVKNAKYAMPYFRQEILESCEQKGGLDSKEYRDALQKSLGARKIIDDMMKQNRLLAIAGTSIGPAHCTDLVNGDYDTGFYFCPPAAMAGYPHITVPMGMVHGLPVGLSFIAGAWQEPVILGLAYAFEQATRQREAPKFLPTLL